MNYKKQQLIIISLIFLFVIIFSNINPTPINIDLNNLKNQMIEFINNNPEIIERQQEKSKFNNYLTNRISNNNSRNVISVTCPVFLVQFPDNNRTVEERFFDNMLNDFSQLKTNYPNTRNVTSAKGYYLEESNYTIELNFDIYNWTILDKNYSYYTDGQYGLGEYPQNTHGLFEDLISEVDSFIDFSQYDMNNDGYVDFITIIHSGPGQEMTGSVDDMWSHKTNRYFNTNDGVTTEVYSMQPEYVSNPYDGTIGVFVHEFGHLLFGLPDLYDTDYSSNGIGYFGIMSFGSWGSLDSRKDGSAPTPLTQYHKIYLEFEDLKSVSENNHNPVTLKRGEILKIKHSVLFREYLLVYFPKNTPYSNSLPGNNNGLIIEHIDENKSNNSTEWYPELGDPMSTGRFLVQIKQQDGLFELEKRMSKGEQNDLFYEGKTLIHNNTGNNNYNFNWYYSLDENRYINITKIEYNSSLDEYTLTFNESEPTIEVKQYKILQFKNRLGNNIVLIKTIDNSIPTFESETITENNYPDYYKNENDIYFYNLTDYQMENLFINEKQLIEYSI